MCNDAQEYLKKFKANPLEEYPSKYGMTFYRCKIDESTRLNETPKMNGKRIIRWMYRKGNDYNYAIEPPLPEKTSKIS